MGQPGWRVLCLYWKVQGHIIADFLQSAAKFPSAASGAGELSEAEGDQDLHREVMEMYELHSAWLLRFARMTAGREDGSLAQDGVQETFFRYFVFRREGNTVDDPRKWLHQYLREYLERALVRSARDESVRVDSGGGTRGVHEIMFDVQRRLPQLLSPRELQAMRLRAEGFRYAEIADALNVTVGTVGTMIARAVKKLQSEFGPRENLNHGRSDE